MTVLILGGTAEARALAGELVAAGVVVTSSLAGRVRNPVLPPGEVRIGGFGGVPGLAAALAGFAAVVDATHPFAERITANAVEAATATGVPLLVLRRPGWTDAGAGWQWAPDLAAAAAALPGLGTRPFLTIGRQGLAAFAGWPGWCLVRCVEPPEPPTPSGMALLLARGPFDLDGERALLREHRVDVLVTKDSGGPLTEAKLSAAAELDVAVLVVRRPPPPAGVPTVATVAEALAWVLAHSLR